jgi:hypothetical protein
MTKLLSRFVPTTEAAAACTIADRWVWCGGCVWVDGCYRHLLQHQIRENDCRWYNDGQCGSAVDAASCC